MDSSPASPLAPRDPSSPESSIGEQIATLQAQLAALQASQPAAAAAAAPPAVTVVPGNAATASKVVFPKHARLDGPKSFTNWLRQLRLALPNQVRGYVLDGVVPPTWTADQLAARDDAAREIIVGSIDSADVSATLDAIPSDDLSAPRIFAALKARFAPDDAVVAHGGELGGGGLSPDVVLVAGHCFAPGLGVASDRFDGLDGVEGGVVVVCGDEGAVVLVRRATPQPMRAHGTC
ncbi:BZ3500_MvSof-1268-A1-R1_C040g00081 [Microbotryum saponariae]|uniref:BZ3500_MvSof-1268-A1-R1_C040g00081 protein n=1 Tax=Microbotryum saponariae TaxID=289078 RepID=A0A2X0MTS0_9BASI|nr:BZ3500_MvSof-1268-A1-R1_C040g00081 [Microbotryum saponariae]SDA03465.1 BZ3501_MvSof-1269-A2-R1_Chr11g03057 [Microbotryum saponariae]